MFVKHRKKIKSIFHGNTRVIAWDQHQLIYVRIPKSGNSSIRTAIENGEARRMRARSIAHAPDHWTTFSFVRNPWSRLVSAYMHKASESANTPRLNSDGIYQGFLDLGLPVKADISFEEFTDIACNFPDHKTDKHLQSQSFNLFRNEQPIVKFIGKLEHIESDWEWLMNKVGLTRSLPHINQTHQLYEHYSEFYNSERLIQQVADRYIDDIENFDYTFERQSPAVSVEVLKSDMPAH